MNQREPKLDQFHKDIAVVDEYNKTCVFHASPNDFDARPGELQTNNQVANCSSERKPFNLLLNNVLRTSVKSKVIGIYGDKSSGKSLLVNEFIAQAILQTSDAEVLFIDAHSGFNISNLPQVCKKYVNLTNEQLIARHMQKLKIVRCYTCDQFQNFLGNLEGLILLLPKMSLIVIDSLAFYHKISYAVKIRMGRRLSKKMYLNFFLKKFRRLAKAHNVTIIFTLPTHMLSENEMEIKCDTMEEEFNFDMMFYAQEIAQVQKDAEADGECSEGERLLESRNIPEENIFIRGEFNPDIKMFTARVNADKYSIKMSDYENGAENEVQFTVDNSGVNFVHPQKKRL